MDDAWDDQDEDEAEDEPVFPDNYFRCQRCGMMAEEPALLVWTEDGTWMQQLCHDCFGRLTGLRIAYPPYQRKRDDPWA